jgi:hypothetical protein
MHLCVGKERAEAWPEMSSVQLPLLVHAAITGDERPALPVAGACTLLYLGADLFDSILDHELPTSWQDREPSEASLAATTLLGALPQLSIDRLQGGGTPPERLWTLARIFADYGLRMGAGQYEDLLFPSLENVSIEDSRAMAERKSGAYPCDRRSLRARGLRRLRIVFRHSPTAHKRCARHLGPQARSRPFEREAHAPGSPRALHTECG